ncbi:MAG: SpoIIE family protein phosphatase [Fusobacteriaceae bacterium]|nr:SpoIIE family protein phosphatase [Fusobacteriaceae bacterium]MBP6467147.1 SpoIIE family protein phosphatase [Fusobacteriaceae bacterium]MBP9596190.1 SpoIIE family protein phosphatase [Fusobacteriaceae bacterium]MBU9917592.1 SpoIIE family protein phosphatase [Fusobacteriaceae bacterium]
MGVAITLVFALIIGGLFFKRQNESALEELDSLIHSIFNREENPVIRDELKDEYEELIKDIKEQEKALNDSIKEINVYQRELNLAYKSVLAKTTELEYSNTILEKRVNSLSQLNAISQTVLSELDLDKIIGIIMDAYFVLADVKKIALYLWEDDRLVNKIFKGNIKGVRDYRVNTKTLDKDSLYERIVNDIEEKDEKAVYSKLSVKGKDVGVIYIISNTNDEEDNLEEANSETISALAMQVAIALNNSIMYSELAIKERIAKELSIAANIQKNLLPKELKISFALDLAEYFKPAKEIGGDYYDYNFIDDTSLFLTIGDVSGKGIPAALLMTSIRATLKSLCHTYNSVDDMLIKLNYFMCKDMSEEMFVTIFHSHFNNQTKTLTYSNAGHNPLLVYKAKEIRVEEENVKGTAIGFLEGYKYKLGKIVLNEGDVLLYYTDGITEAENANKELFGIERLKRVLLENSYKSAQSIKEEILKEVDNFREGYEQVDDITLLVVKI